MLRSGCYMQSRGLYFYIQIEGLATEHLKGKEVFCLEV